MDASARAGHNAGPPLDEDEGPPWGDGDPYLYVCWDRAWKQAWKSVPHDIMMFRLERAEALGLTYEEYTLEILERGRHLQAPIPSGSRQSSARDIGAEGSGGQRAQSVGGGLSTPEPLPR